MKHAFPILAILGLSLTACGETPTLAEPVQGRMGMPALKSGEQVFREVCMACHAAGVANAPQFGDREDWGKLVEEGQDVVTAHGWVGMRGMPPRGGRADLELEEFARAVAWMARSVGADWQDPDADMLHEIREEEKKRIEELKKKTVED